MFYRRQFISISYTFASLYLFFVFIGDRNKTLWFVNLSLNKRFGLVCFRRFKQNENAQERSLWCLDGCSSSRADSSCHWYRLINGSFDSGKSRVSNDFRFA